MTVGLAAFELQSNLNAGGQSYRSYRYAAANHRAAEAEEQGVIAAGVGAQDDTGAAVEVGAQDGTASEAVAQGGIEAAAAARAAEPVRCPCLNAKRCKSASRSCRDLRDCCWPEDCC